VRTLQKQVKLHLRSDQHHLGIEAVKVAQEWTSKHKVFESQQEVHDNLPPRPDDAPPIAALGPPGTGAIRYEFIPEQSTSRPDCRYVGTDLRRIREHLRVEHNWDLWWDSGLGFHFCSNGLSQ
jgi:hypothetical protein